MMGKGEIGLFFENRVLVAYLFFTILVVLPRTSLAVDFFPLKDISPAYGDSFKEEINVSKNIQYEIGRVHVNGPYYDGVPGYNVIFVQISEDPKLTGPKDVFTLLLNKQLKLFGFSSSTHSLYTYVMGQDGMAFRIKNIAIYSPEKTEGRLVGPSGSFQYASSSPDGVYCLLVNSSVFAVNLTNGKWHEIKIPSELIKLGYALDSSDHNI